MVAIYLNSFRLAKKLENFRFLEMSKQFIVSINLHNVPVAATAVRLAVITAHVVITAAIKHALFCESIFDMGRFFIWTEHISYLHEELTQNIVLFILFIE